MLISIYQKRLYTVRLRHGTILGKFLSLLELKSDFFEELCNLLGCFCISPYLFEKKLLINFIFSFRIHKKSTEILNSKNNLTCSIEFLMTEKWIWSKQFNHLVWEKLTNIKTTRLSTG
jgi:hypothetical protein